MQSKRFAFFVVVFMLSLGACICSSFRGVPFTAAVSEEQLKSRLDKKLEDAGFDNNVSELEVTLANELITLDFVLSIDLGIATPSTPGTVVFDPEIDGDGNLVLNLVSANFGQVNVPDEILGILNQTIVEAIIENARDNASTEVQFTELSIADGEIVVSGYLVSVGIGQ